MLRCRAALLASAPPCFSAAAPQSCGRASVAWCVHPGLNRPSIATHQRHIAQCQAGQQRPAGAVAHRQAARQHRHRTLRGQAWRCVEVKWAPWRRLKCCHHVDEFPVPDLQLMLTKRSSGPFCDSQCGAVKCQCAGAPSTHHQVRQAVHRRRQVPGPECHGAAVASVVFQQWWCQQDIGCMQACGTGRGGVQWARQRQQCGAAGGGSGGRQGRRQLELAGVSRHSKARHRTAEQLSSLQEQRRGRRAGTGRMSRQTPAHWEGRASSRNCWNCSAIDAGRAG